MAIRQFGLEFHSKYLQSGITEIRLPGSSRRAGALRAVDGWYWQVGSYALRRAWAWVVRVSPARSGHRTRRHKSAKYARSKFAKLQIPSLREIWNLGNPPAGLQLAGRELCVLLADGRLVRTHSVAHAHAIERCPA